MTNARAFDPNGKLPHDFFIPSCRTCFSFTVMSDFLFFYCHAGPDPASRWNKESILNLDSGVKHQNDPTREFVNLWAAENVLNLSEFNY